MATETPENKTLVDLEWADLMARISGYTVSELAGERLRHLTPAATREEAEVRATPIRELLDWMGRGEALPIRAVADIRDALARAGREASLSAADCLEVLGVLTQAAILRQTAAALGDVAPALSETLASERSLEPLRESLERCIDPDGTVADRASDDLVRTRRKVRDARRTLTQGLERAISRYRGVLRDAYHTEIDGRYGLPVRSDAEYKVDGIVLGTSGSGGTLYIEPREITELGNRLKVVESDAERAEQRVLAELSTRVRELGAELETAFEACLGADQLNAIARWANATRSIAVSVDPEPVLVLRAARHPLLVGGAHPVVANDLELRAPGGLILSGPNAGGKTVALKCLGLAALMVRSGLPLPVAPGSRVGWFDPVVSDIGDGQSLAQSLSTFTGHVVRLARCLDLAGSGALFLLDELAAGTDPDQGSALAVAILEGLVERGGAVAVTTHYNRLKQLGDTHPSFQNAAVGFDVTTMSPTFRVVLGQAGASAALAVAERFGLPPPVVQRARELLPKETLAREDLIARLEAEHVEAERLKRAAERERADAQALREELEAERAAARAKHRAKLERDSRALTEQVREARAELRRVVARLRESPADKEELRALSDSLNTAASTVALGAPLIEATRPPAAVPQAVVAEAAEPELEPGMEVLLVRLNQRATVLARPSRGQVKVAAGPLKLSAALSDVRVVGAARRRKTPERPRLSPTPNAAASDVIRTRDNTCDVRGMRVEEALTRIDAFVSELLGTGDPGGFVLHGHGTGALKTAIRQQARSLPHIVDAQAATREQGGDAFTVLVVG